MKKTYCISYDLIEPGQDYDGLHDAIKSYGYWWHHLDSTWFIKSDKKVSEILKHLSEFIDEDDKMIVFEVGNSWWSKGFTKRALEWLHKNFKS